MNKHIDFYDALDQVVSIAHQQITDLECNPEQFGYIAEQEIEREGVDMHGGSFGQPSRETITLIDTRAKEIQRRYRDSIDAVEKLLITHKETFKSFGGVMLRDSDTLKD